jgi:hypothetical protein
MKLGASHECAVLALSVEPAIAEVGDAFNERGFDIIPDFDSN